MAGKRILEGVKSEPEAKKARSVNRGDASFLDKWVHLISKGCNLAIFSQFFRKIGSFLPFCGNLWGARAPRRITAPRIWPNTNGSQFSIWTGFPFSRGNVLMELVGKDEYFRQELAICGHVVEGMDIVAQIEKFRSTSGSTSKRIVIDDCGEVD